MNARARKRPRTQGHPTWTLVTCVLASSLSFVEGSVLGADRGLIATALLGAVLASEGEQLFAGFHAAMTVSAAVAASAAMVALTMLGGVKIKAA